MDEKTSSLFNVIFQEAHVIDFDFSQWDRRLRLVVVAGLVGDNFERRGPLHQVDFLRVASMNWEARHLSTELDAEDQHFQWVVVEFDLQASDQSLVVRLSGVGPAPVLTITCSDVRIAELDPSVVDGVNPEWNRPFRPLARPGFEELRNLHRRGV